jgi:hypothetical protein
MGKMTTYQSRHFNLGAQVISNDLKRGIPISSDAVIGLLNEVLSARGEMTEQIFHRDNNLEIVSTTSEKFPTVDALGHKLGGQIRALVDFANDAMKAGVRHK